MRLWRYTFAGVACAALIGASAGCARTPRVDQARVPGLAARLDAVSQLISGTPRQRLAGEVIAYHAYQDPIRQCMARAGFTYTPPMFVNPYAGMSVIHMGTGDEDWFAPLQADSLGVGEGIQRLAGHDQLSANPGYTSLDAAGRVRYNGSLDGCQPAASASVNFPTMSQTLTGAFLDMLDAVDSTAQVKAAARGYQGCLAQHGVTATSHDDLVQRITTAYGTTSPPTPNRPASSAWLAAQDAERKAAAADATCRKPIYDIAMTLVEPKLTDFTTKHSADFAVLAQQWDAMVAQASRYPEFH